MLRKKATIITVVSVIAAVLLILAAGLYFVFSATPEIKVSKVENNEFSVFSEAKIPENSASVKILWMTFGLETRVSGKIDTEKLGNYTLTYETSFINKTVQVKEEYKVTDKVAPEIKTDIQSIQMEFDEEIKPEDINFPFTAKDNYDGNLTDKVTKTVKDNICTLSVSDSSGNTAKLDITISFSDGENPVILLNGPSTVYVAAGSKYSESGYSAKDNMDGDITSKVKVTGKVDTSKSGTYYKEYAVTDEAGNYTKIKRKIIVYGANSAEDYEDVTKGEKVVYLTFDDGPGAYTARLLSCLEKYDVKATFFVTNQFSRYQSVIGDIHKKGHKVAIHTKTHKWSIYDSVENFMADFNGMQKIIKKQTGQETNVFRFPGGTNNTVSKGHSKGIMTKLSKQLAEAGYRCFDWDVDSYDSRSNTKTQDIISKTISQISGRKTAVVLMHDIHLKTVNAVPAIIEYCLENGYTFKVLDENAPRVQFKPAN
jgi:peptidoglycan/xylan/chitin deacetylase (PgdA/CDA1 family)